MAGKLRRATGLAWLGGTELLLRALGRRRPYRFVELELRGELAEESGEAAFGGLLGPAATDHLGLLAVLRWARHDPQLEGVFVRCREIRAGWARGEELRGALQALRQAGKEVWFHLHGGGPLELAVASAATRVSIDPAATLQVSGLVSEAFFLHGLFEKLGVEPEVVQVGRYKAIAEMFTRSEPSAEHREMLESLVDDLYGQLVETVASGRARSVDDVREALDSGPLLADAACRAGLVDEVAYADEVRERVVERAGGEERVLALAPYARRRGREIRRELLRRGARTVAVVHVHGTIRSGESRPGPAPAAAAGADSLAAALDTARRRDDVAAVVLRVSSPGGSGAASDRIWREVALTRRKKPVVVSLGDVAASGGYYVAVGGAPVLAGGATLTGSIGVVAGKALLRDFYTRLGVAKTTISRGRYPALQSDYLPLGPAEREKMREEAEAFYRRFVQIVAEGRRMDPADVERHAEGRVWTGRQAYVRGLIDRLGGLEDALVEAKRAAGIDPDQPVLVERLPRPPRLLALRGLLQSRPTTGPRPMDWLPASLEFMLQDRAWAIFPMLVRFR